MLLCRCVCDSGSRGTDVHNVIMNNITENDEVEYKPVCESLLSYSIALDQPLIGSPLLCGELWHLVDEWNLEPVEFKLYINGFSVQRKNFERSVSLHPFAFVEKYSLQHDMCEGPHSAFKITTVKEDMSNIYAACGNQMAVQSEQTRWILLIAKAIRMVTQSLFPVFNILCDPLSGRVATYSRILAGYIIHHTSAHLVSVVYCELHPHEGNQARFVVYETEVCAKVLMAIPVYRLSPCEEQLSIGSSCFSLEGHHFSTRTPAERKLWMRAISNVKAKLMHFAPNPTLKDLAIYRTAIKDHITTIKSTLNDWTPLEALLRIEPMEPISEGEAAC